MKKLKPKQIRNIVLAIFFVGAVFSFLGISASKMAFTVVGLVLFVASVVVHVGFYRCPICGKYLFRSIGEYCPNCGAQLNE